VLRGDIAMNVSGDVASISDPLCLWLEAKESSLEKIEVEALEVFAVVTSVEMGIRIGYDLLKQVSWKIPSDAVQKNAILRDIRGNDTGIVSCL
jgi:hypothetical protein